MNDTLSKLSKGVLIVTVKFYTEDQSVIFTEKSVYSRGEYDIFLQ